mmetsp:Transcript_42043/g.88266  ORF Transcript_42043/g.88266 Transcript_42043/m.88266 type:complete len:264 (+) Transcript_42043:175-966(+)
MHGRIVPTIGTNAARVSSVLRSTPQGTDVVWRILVMKDLHLRVLLQLLLRPILGLRVPHQSRLPTQLRPLEIRPPAGETDAALSTSRLAIMMKAPFATSIRKIARDHAGKFGCPTVHLKDALRFGKEDVPAMLTAANGVNVGKARAKAMIHGTKGAEHPRQQSFPHPLQQGIPLSHSRPMPRLRPTPQVPQRLQCLPRRLQITLRMNLPPQPRRAVASPPSTPTKSVSIKWATSALLLRLGLWLTRPLLPSSGKSRTQLGLLS